MNIGFEAQRILRSHKHGMDFVALELLKAFRRSDSDFRFTIFANEGEEVPEDLKDPRFTWKITGGSYPVWEQFRLPVMAREAGVDLLHCTANTAPLRGNIPLVVTLHDVIFLEKNPLFAPGYTPYQRFGNVYRKWVVKRMVKKTSRILTVSEFERENIYRQFPNLPPEHVEVVYNAAGPHFKEISDKDVLRLVRQKYNLPAAYILFLGNTDPKKNTPRTLRAYAQWKKEDPGAPDLVVGDLKEDYVRAALKEGGLEHMREFIRLTGYIANTDLPALMGQAEFFLYPSLRESFGIPVLEAMASGAPVITSRTSSMPEVGGLAAEYVDPYSEEDLVRAMRLLHGDARLRENRRSAGLERATHFHWDRSAAQLLNIYRSII